MSGGEGLAAWLREAILERKARAGKAATVAGPHWVHDAGWSEMDRPYSLIRSPGGAIVADALRGPDDEETGPFIAANDPRDVIARCEAELGILDEHASDGDPRWPECVRCASTHPDRCECDPEGLSGHHLRTAHDFPCRTVRLLGTGYRYRGGYKAEEWAP